MSRRINDGISPFASVEGRKIQEAKLALYTSYKLYFVCVDGSKSVEQPKSILRPSIDNLVCPSSIDRYLSIWNFFHADRQTPIDGLRSIEGRMVHWTILANRLMDSWLYANHVKHLPVIGRSVATRRMAPCFRLFSSINIGDGQMVLGEYLSVAKLLCSRPTKKIKRWLIVRWSSNDSLTNKYSNFDDISVPGS